MAVPAGMVIVPAARQASQEAAHLGGALIEALGRPIYAKERVTQGVDEEGRPYAERTAKALPAGVALGLLVGGGALMARGLRTGVIQMADYYLVSWQEAQPSKGLRGQAQTAYKTHYKTVTVPPGQTPSIKQGAVNAKVRFLARRPVWQAAGSVQPYQPLASWRTL